MSSSLDLCKFVLAGFNVRAGRSLSIGNSAQINQLEEENQQLYVFPEFCLCRIHNGKYNKTKTKAGQSSQGVLYDGTILCDILTML